MKNAAEIQKHILAETGLKTSVRIGRGSMNGYVIISPMFQNGKYETFPFDFIRNLKAVLSSYETVGNPIFASIDKLCVFGLNPEKVNFKTESKPKPFEQLKGRTWGSKNSQVRLDKATARNAKRMQKGNTARYY